MSFPSHADCRNWKPLVASDHVTVSFSGKKRVNDLEKISLLCLIVRGLIRDQTVDLFQIMHQMKQCGL